MDFQFSKQDLDVIHKINQMVNVNIEGSCSVASQLFAKYLTNEYPNYDIQIVESCVDVSSERMDSDNIPHVWIETIPHVWIEINNNEDSCIIDLTADQFFYESKNIDVYEIKYIGTKVDINSIYLNPYSEYSEEIIYLPTENEEQEIERAVDFDTTDEIYRTINYQRFTVEEYQGEIIKFSFSKQLENIINNYSVPANQKILHEELEKRMDIVFNNNEINLEHTNNFIKLYLLSPNDFKNAFNEIQLKSSVKPPKLK